MENNKKFYITTPIYYPSGNFHIGTAYCEVLTDAIKRYKQARGYDTFMLTGLDEHGQKIQTVADKKRMSPQEHVDEMAEKAKKLWKLMDINYDRFIRTTDDYHCKAVQKIVQKFVDNGDIYKGKYEDWYCMPCENYFTETQLVNGKCPDCGREVRKMSEDAYFFNMKKYEGWLKEFYAKNPDFIVPESRKNEIFKNFIEPGLQDLCISRNTFDWGIPLPNDPEHVLYVWLDALTNYITALGYGGEDESLFNKYWPADLHVVGKEIIRFHGIYWPIFLHALGLELPKQIYAHSWVVMKDGKMSKSVGNVIYPEDLISRYGVDATKYYLLRLMGFAQDSMFTPEDFVERFNSDLANDLGNLLNRTIGMMNKYFGGVIPTDIKVKTEFDENLEEFTKTQIVKAEDALDTYHISNGLAEIWAIISRANKYIDETCPWVLTKSENEEDKEKLKSVMFHLAESLRKVAILITPFMQQTGAKMLTQLGIDANNTAWDLVYSDTEIKENTKVISQGEPLFVRLDKDEEIEYIKSVMRGG
ncbi:MAG: methionine--tRNA ligase [Clostridia bacterium]|nr:methionine--tRNA ligase [Clostridia bacterium]